MKKLLFLLFAAQIFTTRTSSTKLILHFDINKTIIAEDIVNNKMLDTVLIESLAKQYKAQWDTSLPYEMSYVQYIKQYLVPGDKSNKEIRKKRNIEVLRFFDVLAQLKDPNYLMIKERFENLRKKVQSQQGKIFASFYKLITYLDAQNISYSIILRTFGTDLADITQELAPMITFEWEGYFNNGKLYLSSTVTQEQKVLETIEDIFRFFTLHRHIKIKDNFTTWNDNHEKAEYGKLFPINREESTIASLFFDDNADEAIINSRDIKSGFFVEAQPLIHQGIICSVNTLYAIEDDDYFIKHLKKIGIFS